MRRPVLIALATAAFLSSALSPATATACTRCMHRFADGRVIVGRSMDWVEDPGSELWVFPRGIQRDGNAGANSLKWTSRFGSVVVSFYGVASVDGMNEQGLVVNTLYLAESRYGTPSVESPGLSIGGWAQYILDSYATVAEAVAALEKNPFTIVAPTLPNGEAGVGHVAMSDTTGDSAILEYLDGRLVIHHGKDYTVMTNSPPFDQQLALNAYWQEIGGDTMLPGTIRASDRFVRASFYVNAIPDDLHETEAVASVLSVIRNASAPLGISTPGKPNIASTIWRTVHDQQERVVYFDSATSPSVFWVPLKELNFAAGSNVLRLPLKNGETYSGDASSHFEPTKPYAFLKASKPE